MDLIEVNLDGLVGPTHNYAGLGKGNVASLRNRDQIAYPKEAALQGLAKMRLLHDLGIPQLIMPPARRPCVTLSQVSELTEDDLRQVYSASSMWVANAATVTPSVASRSGQTHLTVANLYSNPHRRFEAAFNHAMLKNIVGDSNIQIHPPLPDSVEMADEGGANHMTFTHPDHMSGGEIFVCNYQGKTASGRQSQCASQHIMDEHQSRAILVRQHPHAVQAGVFHNDVIAMSTRDLLILHECAWEEQHVALAKLQDLLPFELRSFTVPADRLSLKDAVQTYFFNSQLVYDASDGLHLVMPEACRIHAAIEPLIDDIQICFGEPITRHYLNLHESMRNGGGPACLRLRIPMTRQQILAIPEPYVFTGERFQELTDLITTQYPESISPRDLTSLSFAKRSHRIHQQLAATFSI